MVLLISGAAKAQNLLNNTFEQVKEYYESSPKHSDWEYDAEDNTVSFVNKEAGVMYAAYFTNNKVTVFKLLTDKSMYGKVSEIFDSKYKKISHNTWVDYKKRMNYNLEVKQKVLFTTITPI